MRKSLYLILGLTFLFLTTDLFAVEITMLHMNSTEIQKYEKFELTFMLDKNFANPFDPDEANILLHVIKSDGKEAVIPAFFYQGFDRELDNDKEKVTIKGSASWKARYSPGVTGIHSFYLTVNGEKIELPEDKFNVTDSVNKGFIRRSTKNPYALEFENGELFYPIGHNVRFLMTGQYDSINPAKGTYMLNDYMQKMSLNGENWTTLGPSPKWLGLEWSKDEYEYYEGIGRYNQKNAFLLDRLIEKAEERAIYVSFFLINHGQFAIKAEKFPDGIWDKNPFNKKLGGFLEKPNDYFTDYHAKKTYKNLLRYAVARWGYSSSILCWSLVSEADLVQNFIDKSKENERWEDMIEDLGELTIWHNEMSIFLKSLDINKHLVSTSFAYISHGMHIWKQDKMDIIQTTAFKSEFGDNSIDIIKKVNEFMEPMQKPFCIVEFGGRWNYNEPEELRAHLHSGIWLQYMSKTFGSTGFWWWNFINKENLYHQYKALAKFHMEEPARDTDYLVINPKIKSKKNIINCQGILFDERAYFWVYDQKITYNERLHSNKTPAGTVFLVKFKNSGKYKIEFWDTYEGEIISSKDKVSNKKGIIKVVLPAFTGDIAVKIKRL
ncbi:MAG: DUF5060 domain-containing protein [Candidatus Aureabacteria bacterium]|nr:DUF5060 domain-containing protein [Candidatus Auribacterota bacterium]